MAQRTVNCCDACGREIPLEVSSSYYYSSYKNKHVILGLIKEIDEPTDFKMARTLELCLACFRGLALIKETR